MIRRWGVGCMLLVAVSGCGAGSGSTDGAVDPATSEPGRSLYAEFCSSCHDSDGSGGVGPALADGRVTDRVGGIPEISTIIMEGGDRMPGLQSRLTDEQVDAIARYVLDGL